MNIARITKIITQLALIASSLVITNKAYINNLANKDTSKRELEEDELWAQLRNAIMLRSTEDHILWNIFGIFAAANAILFIALFQTGDFPKNNIVGIIISGVGLSLSVVWFLIQWRTLGHIKRYEAVMERAENKLKIKPNYAVSGWINVEDYDKYLGKKPRVRTVMQRFSIIAGIGWLALISFFIYCGWVN